MGSTQTDRSDCRHGASPHFVTEAETSLARSRSVRVTGRLAVVTAALGFVGGCGDSEVPASIVDGGATDRVTCGRGADGVLRRCPLGEVCLVESASCAPIMANCTDGWCLIQASSFMMLLRPDTETDPFIPRWTTITRPIVMMQTEVTQAQWSSVWPASTSTPTFSDCGSSCPMESMSFGDMLHFANALSDKHGLQRCYAISECDSDSDTCIDATFAGPDCTGYRLPSLAEWQLAASAGYPWSCMAEVDDEDMEFGADSCGGFPAETYAVSIGNSRVSYPGCVDCTVQLRDPCGHSCCGPHAIASLGRSHYGLHDLIGNVMEPTGTVLDTNVTDGPPYPGTSSPRLLDSARERAPHGDWTDPGYSVSLSTQIPVAFVGGSFRQFALEICWNRHSAVAPFHSSSNVGLRLVRTATIGESP